MAIIRIEYRTKSQLVSCLPNESELQAGEQVKITHNGADPLWDLTIKGHLAQPAISDGADRVYLIDFNDSQLNGGFTPSSCDLNDPLCWSCCDANAEKLNNLINAFTSAGNLTENENGTFTFIP